MDYLWQSLLTVHFKLAETGRNCVSTCGSLSMQGRWPVLTLMVHTRTCCLAQPHHFFQVSEPGVRSSSHTAAAIPSCGTVRSPSPPHCPTSTEGLYLHPSPMSSFPLKPNPAAPILCY